MDIIKVAKKRFAENYEAQTGQVAEAAFVETIIEILLSLFQGCLVSKRNVLNPTEREDKLLRIAVRTGLREQYGLLAWRRYDGEKVVESVYKMGQQSTDDEVSAFVNFLV